jgi:hypothetical protein
VIAHGAAEDLNRSLEQDDGCRAIDVVIAVDQDWLARGDRVLDARDCCCHAVECVGIEQVVQRWTQKACSLRGIAYATLEQQPSDRCGDSGCFCKRSHRGSID